MNLFKHLDQVSLPAFQIQQYAHRKELNILFIAPEATGGNFYKILVPYVVLKQTGVVNTAITGWHKYNPIKRFRNDDKHPITSHQLIWADTLVIPFTNQDLSEFMDMARTINPNLRILFHVDFDFIDLPKDHPLRDAFSDERIENSIKNIVSADKSLVTNADLATSLITKIRERGHEISREDFGVQMLLTDERMFLSEDYTPRPKDKEYFTLCVIAGDNQLNDVQSAIPLLLEAKKKHNKRLKIVFFGINKNKEPFPKMVKGLEYIPEGAVPIYKYHKTLDEINPDLVLIPSDGTSFSQRSNDYKRWLDCAILGIPVITPKFQPNMVLIKQDVNGWVYEKPEQFHTIIDKLIENPQLCVDAGASVRTFLEENFTYSQDKLQRLINLLG